MLLRVGIGRIQTAAQQQAGAVAPQPGPQHDDRLLLPGGGVGVTAHPHKDQQRGVHQRSGGQNPEHHPAGSRGKPRAQRPAPDDKAIHSGGQQPDQQISHIEVAGEYQTDRVHRQRRGHDPKQHHRLTP